MKNETITKRVCFFVNDSEETAFREESIEFVWYMGMSWQVRQRSSLSLRKSILEKYPKSRVLEVSTKSEDFALGRALSAFNLKKDGYPVENLFQSAKVFNDGGPYNLLDMKPAEAKRDPRLSTTNKNNDRYLICFEMNGKKYPKEPKSFFYDYLYISALNNYPELGEKICNYDVFTDIVFNQKIPYSNTKGPFNCQARACAIYVWLEKHGYLESYLKNPNSFIGKIYPHSTEQASFS